MSQNFYCANNEDELVLVSVVDEELGFGDLWSIFAQAIYRFLAVWARGAPIGFPVASQTARGTGETCSIGQKVVFGTECALGG